MSRITKVQSKIMKDHLQASMANKFDFERYPETTSGAVDFTKLRSLVLEGKTFRPLFEEVEGVYCSMGSIMISKLMTHQSVNYGAGLRKGFKKLLGYNLSIS